MFDPDSLTDQEQARLNNLERLREAGIEAYPARVQRTHTIAEARALFPAFDAEDAEAIASTIIPDERVSIVGRLKRIRVMGKMSFADLEDGTGQIQIILRRDNLPDGWYNEVWKKLVDLGDFIGVSRSAGCRPWRDRLRQ